MCGHKHVVQVLLFSNLEPSQRSPVLNGKLASFIDVIYNTEQSQDAKWISKEEITKMNQFRPTDNTVKEINIDLSSRGLYL